jgi:WXXGXW repeat (2 copies)
MRYRQILVLALLSLASAVLLSGTAAAAIDIGVSITVAPPELPVYEQPAVPGAGYLWSPGYWAWGDTDYYWVPGTWVLAPQPGYLWTPGYWGWSNGLYVWNGGYWGPHIGFYGGVNYGYGYGGSGYEGGEWRGGAFFYNRSVNNIPSSVNITNVYNKTVINNVTVNRVSFNGGSGGVAARPSAQEAAAAHEQHLPPVAEQTHHEQLARANPALRAAANHGAPPIAATAHAGNFSGAGVVAAHGGAAVRTAPVNPGAAHAPAGAGAVHPQVSHAPTAPPAAQRDVHEFKPPAQGGPPAGQSHPAAAPHAEQKAPAPPPGREHEHEEPHEH